MQQHLTILLLTFILTGFGVLFPEDGFAWPTKFTNCVGCHTTLDPNATISTAINGVAGTTVTVAPGGTFEIDWRWANATNAAGGYNASTEIMLPANTWTIAAGTVNSPAIAGWNTVWDAADGHVWSTASGFAASAAAFPGVTYGYTIDYGGSPWDGDGTGGGKTRNPAADGANTGGTDLDGTTDLMGTDARVTVPAGAAPGAYTVYVLGVGHDGSSKSYISQAITVTVASADAVKPTVTSFTATTPVTTNVNIPITAFTATDNTAVTGYMISESATPPLATDIAWSGTATATYTATAGDGTKTLYPWAKDAAGNVSLVYGAPASVVVDGTAPSVSTTTPTNGGTGVALNGFVIINFSENLNCTTANSTTEITSDSPGWSYNNCSGSQVVFTTAGQANGTLYNVTVTTAVTDQVGNPMSAPYSFSYTTVAVANNPPNAPTGLAQLKIDGVTPVVVGGYTTEASVIFNSNLIDPDPDTVKLQIDTNSDGIFDCESALVAQQANYKLTCALADGSYNWQARTVDNLGATSSWVAFNAANPDFTKDASAPVDGTLAPTAGDGQIVLNWSAATDVHSGLASPAYKLVMASGTTTPPVDCSGAAIYTGDALTYTQTPLSNGIDYAFRLCATNGAGLVSIGSTATAQPAAGCSYSNPTVTILTASKDITTDGGFVDYTLQVTNNDTAICANASYTLSLSDSNSSNFYPSVLAQSSLNNVAPGASVQTSFRVRALANQPNSVSNNSDVTTAADGNHTAVTSAAITTTINVSGGGCVANGNYPNANGDQLISSRR